MSVLFKQKSILALSFLFFISCNSNSLMQIKLGINNKKEVPVIDTTPKMRQAPKPPSPPKVPTPPPLVYNVLEKKFINIESEYNILITTQQRLRKKVIGNVTSIKTDNSFKSSINFEGTENEDNLSIQFKGNLPILSSSIQWIDKPWRIEKIKGKIPATEILYITFKVKKADSDKWEEQELKFMQISSKTVEWTYKPD